MKKLLRRLRTGSRGDTLVEVLVAFCILMLVIAAFGGAIGFAANMQRAADTARDNAAGVAAGLRAADPAGGGNASYNFGDFTVGVQYGSKTVTVDGTDYVIREFVPKN